VLWAAVFYLILAARPCGTRDALVFRPIEAPVAHEVRPICCDQAVVWRFKRHRISRAVVVAYALVLLKICTFLKGGVLGSTTRAVNVITLPWNGAINLITTPFGLPEFPIGQAILTGLTLSGICPPASHLVLCILVAVLTRILFKVAIVIRFIVIVPPLSPIWICDITDPRRVLSALLITPIIQTLRAGLAT